MNLTFIGIGNVGQALATRCAALGHSIFAAVRDSRSGSVLKAKQALPSLQALEPAVAVRRAELVFLATPFAAAEAAIGAVGTALDGKVVVDCTNPVGEGLTHALENRTSGTAQLQRRFPAVQFVKAFSIYGYENFATDPRTVFGQSPVMPLAGNHPTAKQDVSRLVNEAGWTSLDVGDAEAALHLEHMTLLWIKIARVQGKGAHFAWAILKA